MSLCLWTAALIQLLTKAPISLRNRTSPLTVFGTITSVAQLTTGFIGQMWRFGPANVRLFSPHSPLKVTPNIPQHLSCLIPGKKGLSSIQTIPVLKYFLMKT